MSRQDQIAPPGTANGSGSGTPTSSSAAGDAALQGASLAFHKSAALQDKMRLAPTPPAKPKNVGALVAANTAVRDRGLSRPPTQKPDTPPRTLGSRVSRQPTGGSPARDAHGAHSVAVDHGAVSRRLSQYLAGSSPGSGGRSPHLQPPMSQQQQRSPGADSRSPSLIAATLAAASRSASPSPSSPSPSPSQSQTQIHGIVRPSASKVVRRQSISAQSLLSTSTSADGMEVGSTRRPTSSLVSMFEGPSASVDPVKRSTSRSAAPSPQATGSSVERSTSSSRLLPNQEKEREPPPITPKPKARTLGDPLKDPPRLHKEDGAAAPPRHESLASVARPVTPLRAAVSNESEGVAVPEVRGLATKQPSQRQPPTPPKPRRESSKAKLRDNSEPTLLPLQGSRSSRTPEAVARDLGYQASRPVHERGPRPVGATTFSTETFVSASSAPSTTRATPSPLPHHVIAPPPRLSSPSHNVPPSPTRSMSIALRPRQTFPTSTNLPLESLTNAMVAGSLASARLTPSNTGSSSLPPPIPPPRHKSPHLLPTLRSNAKPEEDEDERRRRKHLARSHGKLGGKGRHAHHEGNRRRWREEITPRERKRYEAVWASNRGLHLEEAAGSEEHVANIVVRDIWRRSRLPEDELAEVWNLVDRDGQGQLDREGFVVGMWLIDQRLRGRKIPVKVSQSVWDSALGIRVAPPPRKK